MLRPRVRLIGAGYHLTRVARTAAPRADANELPNVSTASGVVLYTYDDHVVVATAYVDFTSAVGSSRARKTQFTRIRPTTAESNHCRDTTCFAHPRHVEISNCFDAFPNPLGAVASPPDWCFAFISIPRGGGCGLSIAAAGALTRLCAAVAPSRHAHTHLQPATHRAAERNTHENVAMSVE